ncbi:hypothetical protein P3T40_001343 [Paraburkholderia sp. EB58]|jgi:hypothetical protein
MQLNRIGTSAPSATPMQLPETLRCGALGKLSAHRVPELPY